MEGAVEGKVTSVDALGRTAIVVPYMGSAVHEATVTAWHKEVGDPVALGDAVCDLATDKVDTELESSVEGYLAEVVAAPFDVVPIGGVLAWVTADRQAAQAAQPQPQPAPEPAQPVAPQAVQNHGSGASTQNAGAETPAVTTVTIGEARIRVPTRSLRPSSPLARRRAASKDVDLGSVVGSGAGGRIRASDVDQAPAAPDAPAPQDRWEEKVPFDVATHLPGRDDLRPYDGLPARLIPTTAHRRAIARHMSASVATAPQAEVQVDVDMTAVAARIRIARDSQSDARPTYLSEICHAVAQALPDHPSLNATYTDDVCISWGCVNLGVAVDTPSGLVVPVVRNATGLTSVELAAAIQRLADQARRKSVTNADLTCGTFTVSSLGNLGVVAMTPILHQPQAAILGVPAVVRSVVPVTTPDGEVSLAIRPVIRLSLTFDHRIVDGAEAARFCGRLRSLLETP